MELIVNGETHEHLGDGSVASLVAELGAREGQAAVTVNGDLVFAQRWKDTILAEGDWVEVLTFAGGG